MKPIITLFFLVLGFMPLFSQSTITYTESTEDFPNPERGFYRYTETRSASYSVLDAATLAGYRNLNTPPSAGYSIYSSLIFRYFFLEDFTGSAISQSYLDNMALDFAAARTAGVKVIPRFAYTDNVDGSTCASFICPPYGDAPKAQVLAHIAQLAPILEANKDVIAVVQMGFIGTWGENYYTDYFGDASQAPYILTDTNWSDRGEIVQALLDAVPEERMVQVRYPQIKQRFIYGVNAPTNSAALTLAEAHSGTDKSRIAFHNDCFLASADDFGTYNDYGNSSSSSMSDTATLKPYLASETQFVPMGGETCNEYNPYNDCASSDAAAYGDTEMKRLHFSYLNSQFNNDVNNDWEGVCMDAIKRELGYRFVMTSGTYSDEAQPGQVVDIALTLENKGYAAPYNPRGVEFILINTVTSSIWFVKTDDDPRFWFRETSPHTISQTLCIPTTMPTGTYDLYLNLPDPQPSIYSRADYAIRLANTGVWDSSTGFNDLNHSITINNTAANPTCTTEEAFSLTSSFLPIDLYDFTANVEGENIALNWITASETNNAGFNVQRSIDTQSFENIAWVEGNGTTTEMTIYDYLDTDVLINQRFYYRLEQIDTDGTQSYSPVVSAKVILDSTLENELAKGIKLYPNPASDMVQVDILEGFDVNQLIISNLYGEAIKVVKGDFNNVSVSELPEGVYLFVFDVSGKQIVYRQVVMR